MAFGILSTRVTWGLKMTCRKSGVAGFTIVEAMVTVAILGILIAIAVPSMTALIASNSLSSSANETLSAMMLARQEALRTARQVVVCKSSDSSSCSAGSSWADGWIVFVDEDASGTRNGTEAVLRTAGVAKGVSASGEAGLEDKVIYTPRGALTVAGGAPKIVFTVPNQKTRELQFTPTGRVSVVVGEAP